MPAKPNFVTSTSKNCSGLWIRWRKRIGAAFIVMRAPTLTWCFLPVDDAVGVRRVASLEDLEL